MSCHLGAVARLAVLVVRGGVTDAGGLGVVALTHLVGVCVDGESAGVVGSVGGPVAAEAEETAPPGAVARGVVVSRGWAEALLLLALAGQGQLDQGRNDIEDTGG